MKIIANFQNKISKNKILGKNQFFRNEVEIKYTFSGNREATTTARGEAFMLKVPTVP